MVHLNQGEFENVYGRIREKQKKGYSKCSFDFIFTFFSCIDLVRNYKKSFIAGDVVAGFTLAAFSIPQGMAFASLASMPPVIGIYMGFLAPIVYILFGTSRHISVATFAPVAMMVGFSIQTINEIIESEESQKMQLAKSNMTGATTEFVAPVKTPEEVTQQLIEISSSICFFSGIFLLILGLCRLGFVGSYFSVSLVKGFTFGVAFHIGTSQVIKVLGMKIAKYVDPGCLILTWRDIILNLPNTNICSFTFGLTTAIVLYICLFLLEKYKSYLRGIPVPTELIIVIIATIVSAIGNFHDKFNLEIIGVVPTGLPGFSTAAISTVIKHPSTLSPIITASIPIALVSFAITLALAKLLAQKHSHPIHNNQELIALGFVDIVTAFFGCFSSAASPPRSNLQSEVGGHTQVASLITSALMVIVLLFAGPLIYSLPYSVLGAIIIITLRSFFLQAKELPTLFACDKYDFICWTVTGLSTVLLNITCGLVVGIVLSLLSVLWRSQMPEHYEMAQIVDTDKYRAMTAYEKMRKIPETLIFRFGMSLYFSNADLFVSAAKEEIAKRQGEASGEQIANGTKAQNEGELRFFVVDGTPFNFVDHSGAIALSSILLYCRSQKIQFLIVLPELGIIEKLENEKFVDKLGMENIFPSLHDAVLHIEDAQMNGGAGGGRNMEYAKLLQKNEMSPV